MAAGLQAVPVTAVLPDDGARDPGDHGMIDPAVTGVSVLPWIRPEGWYESALVFPLPAALAAQIFQARRFWGLRAPAEFQLEPHLTIHYLGRMTGCRLMELWQALLPFAGAGGEVVLGPVERLACTGTTVSLRLRIDPSPALLALHGRIHRLCRDRFPWFAPGPFVGSGYRPHITVLADADAEEAQRAVLTPTWPVGASVGLHRPVLFFKDLTFATQAPAVPDGRPLETQRDDADSSDV